MKDTTYYKGLITSEFQNSTRLMAWLNALLTAPVDAGKLADGMAMAFSLDSAVGTQLDRVGEIIGLSRNLTFNPTEMITNGGMEIGNPPTGWQARNTPQTFERSGVQKHSGSYSTHIVDLAEMGGFLQYLTTIIGETYKLSFWYWIVNGSIIAGLLNGNGSNWTVITLLTNTGSWQYCELFGQEQIGGTGSLVAFFNSSNTLTAEFYIDDASVKDVSPFLTDDVYRIALRARIGLNQWDGKIGSLQGLWKNIFPTGNIQIQDNKNMTMTVTLWGAFSQIVRDLVTNGYIVPRPEGVLINYQYGATMPYFGFDIENSYISGFDVGSWAL